MSVLPLGADELAHLTRLRTCACVFNAAPLPLRAGPTPVRLALYVLLNGDFHLLPRISAEAAGHFVRVAGWAGIGHVPSLPTDVVFSDLRKVAGLVAAAELPSGHTERLRHTVAACCRGEPLDDDITAALAGVGWVAATRSAGGQDLPCLLPRVPATASAHELVDALLACEAAGGLGEGPIGRLAREAVDRLRLG